MNTLPTPLCQSFRPPIMMITIITFRRRVKFSFRNFHTTYCTRELKCPWRHQCASLSGGKFHDRRDYPVLPVSAVSLPFRDTIGICRIIKRPITAITAGTGVGTIFNPEDDLSPFLSNKIPCNVERVSFSKQFIVHLAYFYLYSTLSRRRGYCVQHSGLSCWSGRRRSPTVPPSLQHPRPA